MRVSLRHTFLSVNGGANTTAEGGERRARSEEPICRAPLQRDDDDMRRQFTALNRLLDGELESPASPPHGECDPCVGVPTQNLPPTMHMHRGKRRNAKGAPPSLAASPHESPTFPPHVDWGDDIKMARPLGKVGQVRSVGSMCTTVPEGWDVTEEIPHVGSSNSVSSMAACGSSNSVCTVASGSSHHQQGSSGSQGQARQKLGGGRSAREPVSPALRPTAPLDPALASAGSASAAQRLPAKDCRHCHVPRNLNLAVEYAKSGHDGKATTIMIRNLPHRCGQRELIAELETLRFGGTFDFLYIPLDPGTMYNVGYAFVNFIDHTWAQKCMEVFSGHVFRRYRNSGKPTAVSIAHIQGLESNLRHYEKSVVNTARLRQRRPVVMANISHSLLDSAGRSEESPRDHAATM